MSFLWRKQEKIEGMLESYFERCDNCFQLFEQAFDNYCENGPCETFNHIVQRTHETESAADDLRRDIEHTLYGKALLPESRGDILGVLESFDKLPNMAETVIFSLRCQHTHIPAEYLPQFRELT
jgi:predicted phosphate transport protein (TIGR00153 family)